MYDIIVVGSGPAGLTAAIYALRANKTVLILEKGSFGGQITYSPKIENYPGYNEISGNELAEKFIEQALNLGADIELEEVTAITDCGNSKKVCTYENCYECKCVIIATGVKHRKTGLNNEDELIGNGISFCAVCDGAFFKGKDVAVLGGGNSALQEAILLSDSCKSVTVIQNLPYLTGEKKLCDKIENTNNINVITDTVITELIGSKSLSGLVINNTKTEFKQNLAVDGLFVAIGLVPENQIFSNVVSLNEQGYFDVTDSCCTQTDGIFVAGDCRKKGIRQITTAVADGAVAALAACNFIDNLI